MNFAVLHDLLMPHMFGEIDSEGSSSVAILEENDPCAKLKRIDICDVPNDSVLIKMDGSEEPYTLFLENHGQRKRCDYLLIMMLHGRGILLFMEMKSDNVKSTEVEQKFMASQCLWDYIVSMLGRFHDCPGMFASYKQRFIRFQKRKIQTKNIAKRGTRFPDGSSPELMKIVSNPKHQISLNDLVRR